MKKPTYKQTTVTIGRNKFKVDYRLLDKELSILEIDGKKDLDEVFSQRLLSKVEEMVEIHELHEQADRKEYKEEMAGDESRGN